MENTAVRASSALRRPPPYTPARSRLDPSDLAEQQDDTTGTLPQAPVEADHRRKLARRTTLGGLKLGKLLPRPAGQARASATP
ncbi:hypothetical protein [Kribbella sp. NPDC004536]|uniref:hypothetical protein n=1 Tax=Kribbella sp. NPDC004536 TaxID=3364106 RepID=UPI0036822CC9